MIVVPEQLSPPGPELLAKSGHRVLINDTLWREPEQLYAALAEAEALIVRNHTRVNAHLLDAAPKLKVINSSRGGVIDEKALLEALERKQLYRAVLDVREVEPPLLDDPLRHCASVILTPHIAGLTAEAQERTAHLLINDVLSVLAGGRAIGQVSLDEALQLADR